MPRTTRSTGKASKVAKSKSGKQSTAQTVPSSAVSKSQHDLPFRRDGSFSSKIPGQVDLKARRQYKTKSPKLASQSRTRTVLDNDLARRHDSITYMADDEKSARHNRRFSEEYGHGRMLEDPSEQLTQELRGSLSGSSTGSKRKAEFREDSPGKKKVRFNPETSTRQIQKDRVDSIPMENMHQTLEEDFGPLWLDDELDMMPLPADPSKFVLEQLSKKPERLDLASVAELFRTLQDETAEFAMNFFVIDKNTLKSLGGNVTARNFPIADLEHKYSSLFRTVSMILEGPANTESLGWLSYFTEPQQKWALAYGILGEWFTQRIFKDSAFGLPQDIRDNMRQDVDIKYLQYDAFVRTKKRATIIEEAYRFDISETTEQALDKAAEELSRELIEVFGPMLATFKFGKPGHSVEAIVWLDKFQENLIKLIKKAAGLSFSYTLTGHDGTLIRVAPRLQLPRTYDELAPMECINMDELLGQKSRMQDFNFELDVESVKMTCWPRIEAYVPHGKDLEELDNLQKEYMEHEIEHVIRSSVPTIDQYDKAYKDFCWECAQPNTWDVLPAELHRDAIEKQTKRKNIMAHARRERRLDRQRNAASSSDDPGNDPNPGNGYTSYTESDSSSSDDGIEAMYRGQDDAEKPPRGNWVTIYECLVPHQVYCEWTTTDAEPTSTSGTSDPYDNTLHALVQVTKSRLRSGKLFNDETIRKAWNYYADRSLWFEWAIFAVILYLSRKITSRMLRALFRPISGISELGHRLDPDSKHFLTQILKAAQASVSSITKVPGLVLTELREYVIKVAMQTILVLPERTQSVFRDSVEVIKNIVHSSAADVDATSASSRLANDVRTMPTPVSIPIVALPTVTATPTPGKVYRAVADWIR